MKIINVTLSLILAAIFIASCNDSTFEETGEQLGKEYFPLEIGNTWIYDVDSTVYTELGTQISDFSGQVREVVTDISGDNQFHIIERSHRRDASEPWRVTETFTATVDENQATKTVNNLRFIKLVFPIREGKDWDGNVHFDDRLNVDVFGEMLRLYDGWDYEMSIQDTTVNDITYSDAIKVDHINRDDGLVYTESYEYYAKDIGLVYKKFIFLATQDLGSTSPWEEKADKGLEVELRLVSFTK